MDIAVDAAARRSWLCPTDADLQRYYEALPAINRARRQVIAVLLPVSATLTPWIGVPNIVLILVIVVVGLATDRLAVRWSTTVVVGVVISAGFQTSLSIGVALTGGVHSPYLVWLVVPVTMLAARYRPAVVIASVCVALGLAAVACAAAEVAGTARDFPTYVLGLTTAALMGALVAIVLNLQSAELESRRAATTDPLTGVRNRKDLDSQVRLVAARTQRSGGALSVMLLDLDHFKAVNDKHGHATGDEVLRQVTALLTGCLRPDDLVFRVGGEEFLVVLPLTDAEQAVAVAERVRTSVSRRPVAGLRVTVSIGVAAWAESHYLDPLVLQRRADAAMYEAKSSGRDRVVVWHEPEPVVDQGSLPGVAV